MRKKNTLNIVVGLLSIVLLLLAGCGQSRSDSNTRVLKVGLIPNQAPDKIKAQYEPFRANRRVSLGGQGETG